MPTLSRKQDKAWECLTDATHTEVLYGGAAGGGKSWLGCVWLIGMAIQYKGSRWLMGRAVGKTLKETTLNSFFDVCGSAGMKHGEDYTYNAQTGTITVGRSTIILKDLFAYPSDPNFDDLGSLEITGAFIDEANQITEKAKAIVGSRIRYKLDEFGIIPKMLLTCNPAKNWVYREFYAPAIAGTLPAHRAFIPALVTDNPNISPHYIENLRRMTGPDRARLLDGNWDYDDDPARLMDFDAIRDLFSNAVDEGDKYASVDVARYGSDKTVISLWNGLTWYRRIVMEKASVPQVAEAVRQACEEEKIPRSHIVVDDDGVGGGVADMLPGCYRFNGGGKPIEVKGQEQNYKNLKAQCSYALADRVNTRSVAVSFAGHEDSISEDLGWVKRDKMDHDTKLCILPKEKVKEGLGRSPDDADVMMMRMVFELRGTGQMNTSLYRKADTFERMARRDAFRNFRPR